jgi:hypothetical protein
MLSWKVKNDTHAWEYHIQRRHTIGRKIADYNDYDTKQSAMGWVVFELLGFQRLHFCQNHSGKACTCQNRSSLRELTIVNMFLILCALYMWTVLPSELNKPSFNFFLGQRDFTTTLAGKLHGSCTAMTRGMVGHSHRWNGSIEN